MCENPNTPENLTEPEKTPAETKPKKKKPSKFSRTVNVIITVIAVFVLLVSGTICVRYFMDIYGAKEQAEEISELVTEPTEGYPSEPAEVQPKYRKAYNENNDLVGWITVPNTTINHPVMQSDDNNFTCGTIFIKNITAAARCLWITETPLTRSTKIQSSTGTITSIPPCFPIWKNTRILNFIKLRP